MAAKYLVLLKIQPLTNGDITEQTAVVTGRIVNDELSNAITGKLINVAPLIPSNAEITFDCSRVTVPALILEYHCQVPVSCRQKLLKLIKDSHNQSKKTT